MVKDLVKEMVARTQIEPLARAMYGWVSARGAHDRQLRQVMDQVIRPNSNCVDVGCYQGWALKEMVRRAPEGRHFAIEPIPELFARLKTAFPQVTLFSVAASDREGEETFQHVVSNSARSGIARRASVESERVREFRVVTARLDDLIPSSVAVRFIKLDVQGTELPVFRGALALIRRCHPFIVFEHGQDNAHEQGAEPEEVYDLLTENGLAISLMKDWLSGHSPIARKSFASQYRSRQDSCFLAHP
jgi:FkbM family methyltransferase